MRPGIYVRRVSESQAKAIGLRFAAAPVAVALVVIFRWRFWRLLNFRPLFRRTIIISFLSERGRPTERTKAQHRRYQNHHKNSFHYPHNYLPPPSFYTSEERRGVALPFASASPMPKTKCLTQSRVRKFITSLLLQAFKLNIPEKAFAPELIRH